MTTKVVLKQKIHNLTLLNKHGQYTEKIAEYQRQLDNYPESKTITTEVKYSEEEIKCIQEFLKDVRFSITE